MRCVTAGNAAVGQIEGRLLQAEKGVVAGCSGREQHGRAQSTLAARKSRRELGRTAGVRGLDPKHFVVAREQLDLDAAKRRRAGERVGEHMDAVGARIGGQPEIGDDEPLGGALAVVLAATLIGGRRGQHIDAGLQRRQNLVHGEVGGDLLVQLLVDLKRAGPQSLARLVGDLLKIVGVEVALELAADHGIDQIAVADPVDCHRHRIGIDADQGDALLSGLGQHIGFAGEPREGAAVADIDIEVG